MDHVTGLALAAGRDEPGALASFIRETQPEVWRLCAHLVDRRSADDLTQETFLRAIPALEGFRGDSSARTWLLQIARRTCIDAIRRRTRWRSAFERLATRAVDEAHPPDHRADILSLMEELDPDRRAAFVLTQLLGLSYGEAAEVCGCPIGTIRSRVARAREDLASALSEGAVEESALSGS